MSSLAQLHAYNYNDPEEEEEEEGGGEEEKIETRLPVPEFCRSSPNESLSTEVQNINGKIRNFPHVPGNWATFIHIPVDLSPQFLNYLEVLMNHFKSLNLKLVDDFHISLTKTVVLKHHWIQDFIQNVKKNLDNVSQFKIHLFGLKVFVNEQKTRTFVSLMVDSGEDHLKKTVGQLNKCLSDYNLPPFYENPSFHLSLLWSTGDVKNTIDESMKSFPLEIQGFGFYMNISQCVCSCGNKEFKFYFR